MLFINNNFIKDLIIQKKSLVMLSDLQDRCNWIIFTKSLSQIWIQDGGWNFIFGNWWKYPTRATTSSTQTYGQDFRVNKEIFVLNTNAESIIYIYTIYLQLFPPKKRTKVELTILFFLSKSSRKKTNCFHVYFKRIFFCNNFFFPIKWQIWLDMSKKKIIILYYMWQFFQDF